MRSTRSRMGAAAALAGVAALALTACGGGGDAGTSGASGDAGTASGGDDPAAVAQAAWESTEPVTITISDLPATSKPEIRQNLLNLIADFEKENPHITIEPQEVTWAADTFPTMLASDTVPTVMDIPFTEMQPMIQRGQAADITDYVALDPALGESNASLIDHTRDPEGRQHGVPKYAYTMALYYNRAVFTQAGLDPDNPPKTWDEVREASTTITDKTDAQGFLFMTTENTGGWVFTPIVNGFGGRTVSEDGTKATFDDPAVKQALEFYRDVRWTDDAAGSNFLMNFMDGNQAFAGGQVGMYVGPGNQYKSIVTSLGMPVDDLGLAPLPQDSDGIGTLMGGADGLFSPKATPEQLAAAVKWVSFQYYRRFTDQDYAVSNAQAQVADDVPVGLPELPLVSMDLVNQWLGWVKDEVNVPRDNYTAYIASVTPGDPGELALIGEPRLAAQQIYALEDTMIQTVLTEQDADIDALLADTQEQAQAAIDEANAQ